MYADNAHPIRAIQNYFSLPEDHDPTLVQRAVIVNTAFDGLPEYHFEAARDARNLATAVNSAVQRETAAIFVPLWFDIQNRVRTVRACSYSRTRQLSFYPCRSKATR